MSGNCEKCGEFEYACQCEKASLSVRSHCSDAIVGNLVTLIGRMMRKISKSDPDHPIVESGMKYLRDNNLLPPVIRQAKVHPLIRQLEIIVAREKTKVCDKEEKIRSYGRVSAFVEVIELIERNRRHGLELLSDAATLAVDEEIYTI